MTDLVVRTEADDFLPAITLGQMRQRKEAIRKFIAEEMVAGEDFGPIPGTNGKDVLLKPGAEKLIRLFTYTASFTEVKVVEDWTGKNHDGEPFLFYKIKCSIHKDGRFMGDADGSCNSWEKKYRYIKKQRVCPSCGLETVFVSKGDGGFFCWKNKGGCGRQFVKGTPECTSMEKQGAGQALDPDVADKANTIMKMAEKRALTAACLIVVGASEFFTQDIEPERPAPQERPQQSSARPVPAPRQEEAYEAEFVPQETLADRAVLSINKKQASDILKARLDDRGYAPADKEQYMKIMRCLENDKQPEFWTARDFLRASELPQEIIDDAIKAMYVPSAAEQPLHHTKDAAAKYQTPEVPDQSPAQKIKESLKEQEDEHNEHPEDRYHSANLR